MTVPRETIWDLEPHTAAKHEILKLYLQPWFRIMASSGQKNLNYIDGFCGPGRYKLGEAGSPLVALDVARPVAGQLEKVTFLFTDEDKRRIDHLNSELSRLELPKNFNVVVKHARFDQSLTKTLDQMEEAKGQIAPSFVFIDPFGFAGLPFTLVKRILQKPRCEAFITFMVDAVNRFLTHPEENLKQHMAEIFGTDECFLITGESRIEGLRDLYQTQLQSAAQFVRYFEMRNSRGRTVYLLFFATNNRVGHIKMKEAMWSVDPQGEYKFSDRTSAQTVLFESEQEEFVWPLMYEQFKGRTVTSAEVQRFVEDKTPFLAKHMRSGLSDSESIFTPEADRITVAALKVDGKKRLKNTFPEGALITFPK